jgi:hypothetical protein
MTIRFRFIVEKTFQMKFCLQLCVILHFQLVVLIPFQLFIGISPPFYYDQQNNVVGETILDLVWPKPLPFEFTMVCFSRLHKPLDMVTKGK